MKTLYFLFLFFFPFSALKAYICTWDGSNGNWSDATKWFCGEIPEIGDDVVINGGNVTLDMSPSIDNLTFNSLGTIDGTGSLTIFGDFNWVRGILGTDYSSTGTITVGGLTTLSYTANHNLNKKTLQCNGGLTYAGGDLDISYAGTINVPSGQTFLVTLFNGIISSSASGDGVFNLNGTLHKTGGGDLFFILPFNNTTTINVDNGNLALRRDGTHTGVFNFAPGTSLHFEGTHNLNGATFVGDGITTSGAIVNFNAGTTIPPSTNLISSSIINDNVGLAWNNLSNTGIYNSNFNVSVAGNLTLNASGTIDGTGNLSIAGNFDWVRGRLGTYYPSSGTVSVTGMTTMSYIANHDVNKKTLNCNGGLTLAGGNITVSYDGIINIPSGQTFLVTGLDGNISGDGVGTININGTLHKTGAGVLNVGVPLNNTTTWDIDNGTLLLNRDGTHTGVFNFAVGTFLNLGGTHNLNAAHINGIGDIGLYGALVNFNTGTTIPPSANLITNSTVYDNIGLAWNNLTNRGTYNSNFNVSVAGNLTLNTGGTIEGTGNFNVVGDFIWGSGNLGSYYPSTGTVTVGGLTTLNSPFLKAVNKKTLNCNGGLTYADGVFKVSYDGIVNVPFGQIFLVTTLDGSISGDGVGTLNIDGTLHKTGGGVLTISVLFNSTTTSIIDNGTLILSGGGTYTGNLNIATGVTMNLTAGNHTFTNCDFTGSGTISKTGTATISSFTGNNLSPGASPGVLNVSGYAMNLSGNTYNVELAGYGGPGIGHDQIVVSGAAATLGGTLNISFLGGFEPVLNDFFVIMTCSGGCSGSFTTITHPGSNPNAFLIDITTNPNEVRLVMEQSLPLELLDFQAFAEGETTRLVWRTANEINLSHYEIERSTDGQDWAFLGEASARNSTVEIVYSFTDPKPLPRDNYYRLRMVDLDGSFEYSPVQVARFGEVKPSIQLYPNPTAGVFTINFDATQAGDYLLLVNDAQGRLIRRMAISQTAEFQQDMDLSELAAGVYLVKVINGQESFSQRLLVQ